MNRNLPATMENATLARYWLELGAVDPDDWVGLGEALARWVRKLGQEIRDGWLSLGMGAPQGQWGPPEILLAPGVVQHNVLCPRNHAVAVVVVEGSFIYGIHGAWATQKCQSCGASPLVPPEIQKQRQEANRRLREDAGGLLG